MSNKIKERMIEFDMLEDSNFSYFLNILLSMFQFNHELFDTRTFFTYKLLLGRVGVIERDGEYLVLTVHNGSGLLPNGLPEKYNLISRNGIVVSNVKEGVDFAMCRNNDTFTSEYVPLCNFAKDLREQRVTELAIEKNSRIHALHEVSNQQEIDAINNLYNNSDAGLSYSVVKRGFNNSLSTPNTSHLLTDYHCIQGLQQTTMLYNEIFKRFFFRYGLAMANGNKQAQQSVEEVSSNTYASVSYSDLMLNCVKRFCKDFNKLYDADLEVDYAKVWKEKESNAEQKENLSSLTND